MPSACLLQCSAGYWVTRESLFSCETSVRRGQRRGHGTPCTPCCVQVVHCGTKTASSTAPPHAGPPATTMGLAITGSRRLLVVPSMALAPSLLLSSLCLILVAHQAFAAPAGEWRISRAPKPRVDYNRGDIMCTFPSDPSESGEHSWHYCLALSWRWPAAVHLSVICRFGGPCPLFCTECSPGDSVDSLSTCTACMPGPP